MKQLFTVLVLLISFTNLFSQASFDSAAVSGKIKDHILSKKSEIPTELRRNKAKETIEKRIDFQSPDFDFSKTENAEYLQQRTQDVMIIKFEDIKQTGQDIYVQNGTTRYSLTNLEMHADARGKIIKDLPYQEIQSALHLIKSNNLISFPQAESIYKKNARAGKEYSYANLLVDLTSQTIKWQFHGKPNWQTKKQESIDIDAKSGKILSQDLKTTNTSGSLKN